MSKKKQTTPSRRRPGAVPNRRGRGRATERKHRSNLLALATKVFGSAAAARRWMAKPHAELGWHAPAEHAGTPGGAKAVEVLLVNLHLRAFV